MGSGAQTAAETVAALAAQGERVGVVQMRLYRPFPVQALLAALPPTVRTIGVLDRTKEPGSLGEPLYLDVVAALAEAYHRGERSQLPMLCGGRYGLSSKEFTPAMVAGVFDELTRERPRTRFTVGIDDDVSGSSISYDAEFDIESPAVTSAVFFGMGSDGTVGANKNTIKILGAEDNVYAQGYFVYDSKKSGSQTVSHLRFSPDPIRAPYLVQRAAFVGCHHQRFLNKVDAKRLPYVRQREHALGLGRGEDVPRQPLLRARQVEVRGRVGEELVLPAQPFEEGPHGNQAPVLRAEGQRLPVLLSVMVQVPLIPFQDWLRDLGRAREAALGGPFHKLAQVMLAALDRFLGVVMHPQRLEVGRREDNEARGVARIAGPHLGRALSLSRHVTMTAVQLCRRVLFAVPWARVFATLPLRHRVFRGGNAVFATRTNP